MERGPKVELYVFPLPRMVFFPGTTKPLNVFEPRFVRMVHEAVASEKLIALAFADPRRVSHGGIRPVAGAGRPVILDVRSDGTLLVLVEAIGKVLLRARSYLDSFDELTPADWIDEANALNKENIFLLNRVEKEFTRWLSLNVSDRHQLQVFLNQLKSPFEKINYFCSLMIHDSETQQRLLEVNDVNERLRQISQLLDSEKQYISL